MSSQSASTIVQLNLLTEPPAITDCTEVPSSGLSGIATTFDSGVNFAITIGTGSGEPPPFSSVNSYSLANKEIVSTFTTPVIAAYPTDPIIPNDPVHSLVVAMDSENNLIKFLHMDAVGNLTSSGFADLSSGGVGPQYIKNASEGDFFFISNFNSDSLSIVHITPGGPVLIPPNPVSPNPQGIAVSSDYTRVFVLTADTVDRFSFDPTTGVIAFLGSFAHGLTIPYYPGVNQIAVDPTNTRLFVSGTLPGLSRAPADVLAVFTTQGVSLGTIAGIEANGGVVTSGHLVPTRGIS